MKILANPISKSDLLKSDVIFDGPMIKAVVDINRKKVGIDANMHADIEQMMLENGSEQFNLWGINLYPEDLDEDFIEFDSTINVRPRQNNRSRDVENPEIREKIKKVVASWIR